jgi:PAS domain S-box-containing protein
LSSPLDLTSSRRRPQMLDRSDARGPVHKQWDSISSSLASVVSWRDVAIVVGVLLLISSSVGAFGTIWLYQSERRVSDARELKTRLEQLLTMAVDAETGQRGYVITGEKSYLNPYFESMSRMDAQFAAVGALLDDDMAQRTRLAKLANLLAQKRVELAAVIDARQLNGPEQAAQMVASGNGRALMEQARAVVSEMEDSSNRRINVRSLRAREVRDLAILAGILTFLLTTVGLAVVFRATGKIVKARIDAAREVAENSALLHTVVVNVADALIVVDEHACVEMLNPAAEELCCAQNSEARGQKLETILSLRTRDGDALVSAANTAIIRNSRIDETAILITRDGKRCIEQTATPITDESGRSVGAVVIARDVTVAVEAERRLAESDRRKTEFISVLSHELRNPLAAVRSAIQALSKPLNVDEHSHLVKMADRQMGNMVRLIDDLLDVGRLERGALQLRLTNGRFRDVIEEALEAVRSQLTSRRNVVKVTGLDQDFLLACDPPRLVQVFVNLVANASRYSPEGSLIRIVVNTESEKRLVIDVEDTGMGIQEGDLERIFEMFTQVEQGTDGRLREGLGVGLSLARKIVELHGGTLTGTSKGPGRGSTFRVSLNMLDTAALQPRDNDLLPTVATSRAVRVLVVDDNHDAADALAAALEDDYLAVSIAYSGAAALEKAARTAPDIMLLDIGMPGMDGYELARRVRDSEWGTNVVAIAVTGWGQASDKQRAFEAGFDMHFTKPVDPKMLASAILAAFSSRNGVVAVHDH